MTSHVQWLPYLIHLLLNILLFVSVCLKHTAQPGACELQGTVFLELCRNWRTHFPVPKILSSLSLPGNHGSLSLDPALRFLSF